MRSIDVYGLIQWECDVAAGDRAVDRAVKVCNRHLRETGDELLDVTDSLGSTGWLARSIAVPEIQVLNGMNCYLRAHLKSRSNGVQ